VSADAASGAAITTTSMINVRDIQFFMNAPPSLEAALAVSIFSFEPKSQ
jgi:hypothetical protein